MSLRTALIAAMLVVVILALGLVGALGVWGLAATVRAEAQQRVNIDLTLAQTFFADQQQRLQNGWRGRLRRCPAIVPAWRRDLTRYGRSLG